MSDREDIGRALDALAKAITFGKLPFLSRGELRFDGIDSAIVAELLPVASVVQSLLLAPKKEWAIGRREIVLAVFGRAGRAQNAAAIELLDRRVFQRVCVLAPSHYMGWREFVGEPHAIVVPEGHFAAQAAVGAFLAEAEIGKGRLEIIEVPVSLPEGEDFRFFLRGSSWLNIPPPPEDDVAARVLRAALAIRSIRKDIPKTFRQGFFTIRAVKAAARAKESPSSIATRLHLSEDLVHRWLSAPPEEETTKNNAEMPSEAQRRFVRALLSDIPPLKMVLPEDWAIRKDAVKIFLDQTEKSADQWRRRWRMLSQSKKLRRLLGDGVALSDVLQSNGISMSNALAALEIDPSKEEEILKQEICAVFGVNLPALSD